MAVGPVVLLLTLIRLVLCVRSILYLRKEKLLGAVVAELIKVKYQVVANLYDLKLKYDRIQQDVPQPSWAGIDHSKPYNGLVDFNVKCVKVES